MWNKFTLWLERKRREREMRVWLSEWVTYDEMEPFVNVRRESIMTKLSAATIADITKTFHVSIDAIPVSYLEHRWERDLKFNAAVEEFHKSVTELYDHHLRAKTKPDAGERHAQ